MQRGREYIIARNRILRSWRIAVALLLVSICILGLMMLAGADFDYSRLKELSNRLELHLLCSLLLLSSVNFIIRGLRWHWFTRRLHLDVPISNSVAYYLAGFSLGVTPGRMGELIRLWLLRRGHRISYHRALPLMIADRINDLLIIVVLALFTGIRVNHAYLAYIILAFLLI